MKRVIFILTILSFSCFLAFAQNSGKGFSYQAIARDQNGQIIQNETVILRFSLIRQNETEPTWQEIQAAITDEFGAFSLTIGNGQKTGGTVDQYNQVNFAGLPFWLKVELNDDEDYFEISFRELISVPYAEVAFNASPNPVGTILPFAGSANAVPDGYLLCNGASLVKNAYPALYAVIGNSWGGNTTNFNLPDCRGMFLRGVAGGSTNDPDRASRVPSNTGGLSGDNVGSKQTTQFSSHTHTGSTGLAGSHSHTIFTTHDDDGQSQSVADGDDCCYNAWISNAISTAPNHTHTVTIASTGGNESRPINVYVNYIIKY